MGLYKDNKDAKVGTEIECPVCHRKFIKKQYSHAFCSMTCKDKFHNTNEGDRHNDNRSTKRRECRSFIPKLYDSWKPFDAKTIPHDVEVLAYNEKWKDEDFNPRGIRIGFMTDTGFISAHWWDYQGCYITISKNIIDSSDEKDFYKNHIDNTEPEYWTEIPEFKIK